MTIRARKVLSNWTLVLKFYISIIVNGNTIEENGAEYRVFSNQNGEIGMDGSGAL